MWVTIQVFNTKQNDMPKISKFGMSLWHQRGKEDECMQHDNIIYILYQWGRGFDKFHE